MNEILRQEHKYLLAYEEYKKLLAVLERCTKSDTHNDKDGYKVRSLYFDTLQNTDYYSKIDGLETRRKIRLRIYDLSAQDVFLEMKQKQGENQRKRSLRISRCDAFALQQGNYTPLLQYREPFAAECFAVMNLQCYRPCVIAEYTRQAFCADGNNTRITFDRKLQATESNLDLFDPSLCLYPVTEDCQVLMEVKYDGFLYDYLHQIVSRCDKTAVSASKYCLARKATF